MIKEGSKRVDNRGLKQIYTPEGTWRTIGSSYKDKKIPSDTGYMIKQTIKGIPAAAVKVGKAVYKATLGGAIERSKEMAEKQKKGKNWFK